MGGNVVGSGTAVVTAGHAPVLAHTPATAAGELEPTVTAKELKPKPSGFAARVMLQQSPQRSVLLTNIAGATWTQCTVTIPGQQQARVVRLKPGGTLELPLHTFGPPTPSAPKLTDAVRVDCPQGSATLPAR